MSYFLPSESPFLQAKDCHNGFWFKLGSCLHLKQAYADFRDRLIELNQRPIVTEIPITFLVHTGEQSSL
jgi:hypothetical protein